MKIFNLFILISISSFIIISNCSKVEDNTDQKKVVVSIVPLAEFVEKIGGNKVEITVMVPPGASPHTYEPKPSQLIKVSKADMFIKVGTPIEFEVMWLDKILSTNKKMLVVNASENIEQLNTTHHHHHEHGESDNHHNHKSATDPHIWTSPLNAKIMVENICEKLIAIDAANKKIYIQNMKNYCATLDSLDKDIEQLLQNKKNRKFIVYHPAWSYFANRYHLEQVPVEIDGKEPTAKGIKGLIDLAIKSEIKVIFASPQFNTESAAIIAREIKGEVILIDPLAEEYIANLKKIAVTLSKIME